MPKDQIKILRKCLENDYPAFVIAGTDANAIETMKAYYKAAKEHGCSEDFLKDMQQTIADFEVFQKDEPEKIRIPD